MEGLGEAVKERLLSKQAHLRVQFNENPFSNTQPVLDKKNLLFGGPKPLPNFLFQSLDAQQKQGIQSVQTFEIQELILKSPKGFKGVSAKGYDNAIWEQIKESSFIENQPPLSPIKPGKGVLISYALSVETGLTLGDEAIFVPIMGLLLPEGMPPPVKMFKVEGVIDIDSATSIYYRQGDMDFGKFSQADYQSEIQLQQPEKALEYQALFKPYKVKNWMEENSNLFFALKLEKLIMTLFFVISLVISCLGISSALLLLMTQKSEDIAILQAMGMSQKDIIKSFTKIGLHLSSLALFIGGVFGLSIVLLLKFNRIPLLPEIYQDRTIPAHFLPLDYTLIFLGAWLVSYIFCYLPTHYFTRMNVISLLKRTHF